MTLLTGSYLPLSTLCFSNRLPTDPTIPVAYCAPPVPEIFFDQTIPHPQGSPHEYFDFPSIAASQTNDFNPSVAPGAHLPTTASMNAGAVMDTYVFNLENISPSVPNPVALLATAPIAFGPSNTFSSVAQATRQSGQQSRRFQCETCLKMFDRRSRLDNCRNRHSGLKPYECLGICGLLRWYVFGNPRSFPSS